MPYVVFWLDKGDIRLMFYFPLRCGKSQEGGKWGQQEVICERKSDYAVNQYFSFPLFHLSRFSMFLVVLMSFS